MESLIMTKCRRIHFMSLGYSLNDSWRWLYFLTIWTIGISIYFFADSKAAQYIGFGVIVGTILSLWYGMPSKITPISEQEIGRIERYLESKNFIYYDALWTPKLPRLFYFNSQRIKINSNHIIGPRITLINILRLIDE